MTTVEEFLNFWQSRTAGNVDDAKKLADFHQQKTGELDQLERSAYQLTRLQKTKNGFTLTVDEAEALDLWDRMEATEKDLSKAETDIADFLKATGGDSSIETLQRNRNGLALKLRTLQAAVARSLTATRGPRNSAPVGTDVAPDELVKLDHDLQKAERQLEEARAILLRY
jgi:hypothetical protein